MDDGERRKRGVHDWAEPFNPYDFAIEKAVSDGKKAGIPSPITLGLEPLYLLPSGFGVSFTLSAIEFNCNSKSSTRALDILTLSRGDCPRFLVFCPNGAQGDSPGQRPVGSNVATESRPEGAEPNGAEIHSPTYPGRRFALPWAISFCPFGAGK